jgi:RNA-binding protein 8A
MITNVHKEAQEDDVREMFGEFGEIQNCHLNLDRKTGYCKGYALLEFEKKSMADEAIEKCHKEELLGQTIGVEFAFVAPPGGGGYGGRGGGGGRGGRGGHRRPY